MPDRRARWMKAGPGPYWQRPVDPPSQTARGANRRRYTGWHGNNSWTGRQWRRRLADGRARRNGRDGGGQKDNGRSGPHMLTIRRLAARAATSAVPADRYQARRCSARPDHPAASGAAPA
jgi:hypothetical protein